jgi:hypothetical protein
MSKKNIKDAAKKIEIPYLLHFTHISNLEGIFEEGIHSRDVVDQSDEEIKINDEGRYDGRTNTISLSIAHPNDVMFMKYHQKNFENWGVVVLKKSLLWELDCLFLKHNAADASVSGISDDELSTIASFHSMYDEFDHLDSREEQCLEDFDPTDKQAEVMVLDHIPRDYILGVVLSNRKVKKSFKDVLEDVSVKIHSPNKGVFASRLYRRKWQ